MTTKILRDSNNLVNLTMRTFGNNPEEGAQILHALGGASSNKLKSLLLGTNHEWWSKNGEWGTNETASQTLASLLARQEQLEILSLFGNKLRGNSPLTILRALRESAGSIQTLKELNLSHCQFNTQKCCEELCQLIAEAVSLERCEISGQNKSEPVVEPRNSIGSSGSAPKSRI